jgi:hypothetical protein
MQVCSETTAKVLVEGPAQGRHGCSHARNKLCNLREYGSTLQTAGVAGSFRCHGVFWEDRVDAVGACSLMQMNEPKR